MLFWKKKKSRKNIYKNSVFPRYADKMAGEFDTKKFNCGIYGKNTAVPVAAGETTILSENMRLSIHDEKTHGRAELDAAGFIRAEENDKRTHIKNS